MSRACAPGLAIVVKGYPRLSETFIARELVALERRGLSFSLHALRRPAPDAMLTNYGLRTPCHYLPEYLHTAPLRVLSAVLHAAGLSGFVGAVAAFRRDFLRAPSRARVRRFGQACVLAAELGSSVRHIHCHFAHSPAAVGRYAAMMLGISYSLSAHAKDVWTDPEWDLAGKAQGARFVVTCNGAAFGRLRTLAPGAVLELVRHGVAADLVVARPTARSRDGRDASDPVRLLAVARAVEKKGLVSLIDALAGPIGGLQVRLDHYGDGPLLAVLQARVQALGLQGVVTFHGGRPHGEVIAAMDRSDLFVFPAGVGADGDRDGLPNALLEAQARGLCVVACDAGSVRDAIRDGETGALANAGDMEGLADRIARLASDPSARQRLSAAALERNAPLFDAEAGYDRLYSLLREAVAG